MGQIRKITKESSSASLVELKDGLELKLGERRPFGQCAAAETRSAPGGKSGCGAT